MGKSIEIKGLDKIQKNLKSLQREIHKISREQKVPLNNIFPSSFMSKFTQFSSFNEMVNKSPFRVKTEEDFKNIPDKDWDAYVREKTSFNSWDEMLSKAGEQYFGKQIQQAMKKL